MGHMGKFTTVKCYYTVKQTCGRASQINSEVRSQVQGAGGTWESLQKLQCLRPPQDSSVNLDFIKMVCKRFRCSLLIIIQVSARVLT